MVSDFGGIDPQSHSLLTHYGSAKEAREDGLNQIGLFRKNGRGLDQLAQELHIAGYTPDAEPQTLIDMLKDRTPHRLSDIGDDGRRYEAQLARQELERRAAEESERHPRPGDRGDAYEGDLPDKPVGGFDPTEIEAAVVPDAEVRRYGAGTGLRGREGKITLPSFKGSNAEAALHVARDEFAKLRGEQSPAAARVSEPVADHMAALVAARAYSEAVTEHVLHAVFGPLKPEAWDKFYTAHPEFVRLEYVREQGQNASTIIGPDSPSKTQPEYHAILRSPAFARYRDRWNAVEVPIMNKHYNDAMDRPAGTPIQSGTQRPGMPPINLVRVRQDGSTTSVGGGGRRLTPENVRQQRLGFNRRASGESPSGYETDPRKALLAAHEQGASAAGRANLDRAIVSTGQGQRARPGQPARVMVDGTRMVPVRDVTREHGTQVAKPPETTPYLNPKLRDDYHNAIDLGYSFRIPVLAPALI